MSAGRDYALKPSGAIAADAVVLGEPGVVGAVILTGGSDAATVVLYDNASAGSGTVLCTLKAAINTTVVFTPPIVVNAVLGIFADVTGTAPEVNVFFQDKR